jgi:hypothetical protein
MLTKFLRAASGRKGIQYVGGRAAGYVGSPEDITINLTGLTGGLASAPAIGDFVLIYWGVVNGLSTTPTGYTSIASTGAIDTFSVGIRASYKFMGETPDTTAIIDNGTGDSDNAGASYVSVWRNVDTTTPMDVTATTANAASSVLANPPAITPVTAGAYIIAGGAGGHNGGNQTYSSSNLTQFLTVTGNDTNDVTIGGGYNKWTSGAFDPAAFTFSAGSSTSYSWGAITVALRPA